MESKELQKRIPGALNFKWYEALYLPQWNVYVVPPEEVRENIILVAQKMQKIRDIIGHAITPTSWYRPPIYNLKQVKGAMKSAHMEGKAVDFMCRDYGTNHVRAKLEPLLEELEIRMEDKPGSNWVHIDIREPGPSGRLFKP